MPATSLTALPDELIVQITAYLKSDHHLLAQLCRTCKRLGSFAEARLWQDIEFHDPSWHSSTFELKYPAPFRSNTERAYHNECQESKALDFVQILQRYYVANPTRMKELCARVTHLCTVVPSVDSQHELYSDRAKTATFWSILPHFTNLQTLELHGGPGYLKEDDEQHADEITAPTPPNLRFAKLFGYIPRQVVRWVVRSSSSLERLEIGLLDRPICPEEGFHPRPEDIIEDNFEDEVPDYGSCDETHEIVLQRPLGKVLDGHPEPHLPSLKVLYLCQPARPALQDNWYDTSWSHRAEKTCHEDWKRLLQASASTLTIVILEQRPIALEITQDSYGEGEYLNLNERGDGNHNMLDESRESLTIMEVGDLLTNAETLPALKHVYLYGFPVNADGDCLPGHLVYGGKLMLALQDRGVSSEAWRGKWFIGPMQGGGYSRWTGWSIDEGEDAHLQHEGPNFPGLLATTNLHDARLKGRRGQNESDGENLL